MSAKKPNTPTKGRKPGKHASKKVAKKKVARKSAKKGGTKTAGKVLTDKQKIFCREYLIDLNATQAAIRAGYSEKTAGPVGSQNLSKLNIQTEIARLMEKREDRLDLAADDVLRELMSLAFSDLGEVFNDDGTLKPLSEIPKATRKAIAGIDIFEEYEGRGEDRELTGHTKKVKLWDKNRAIEMLGKHFKMFSDKLELTGKDGAALQSAVVMSPEAEKEITDCMSDIRAGLKIPDGLKPLDS